MYFFFPLRRAVRVADKKVLQENSPVNTEFSSSCYFMLHRTNCSCSWATHVIRTHKVLSKISDISGYHSKHSLVCATVMLSLLVVAAPEKCATLMFSLSQKTLHSADTFFFSIMKQLKVCIAWDGNIQFPSIFNQPGGMSLTRTGVSSSEQV